MIHTFRLILNRNRPEGLLRQEEEEEEEEEEFLSLGTIMS
jgi:hypothetical protein